MAGLFRAIAAGAERKSTDISALTWRKLWGEDHHVKSGVSVNLDSALKVSTVLACARVLANGIAQVPLKLYREAEDGSKLPAKNHPLYKILWRRPNEWMTSYEFRQVFMFHAVLQGNGYAYIGKGGIKRQVQELIPLVGQVIPRQARDYSITYDVYDRSGIIATLPRENVLHLRGPSWNGLAGLDAIQVAREAIGLAIATEETHARFHANSARPGGVFGFEGELSEVSYNRIKAQLEEAKQGLHNAFKTWILDSGAKWTPMLMTGVDSQHIETRRFQIEEICRDLGVFPQMVGFSDKAPTFASAESFFGAHVIHSLQPWAENWQQTLARDLFPDEDDLSAEFSMQAFLRGDHKARAEYYASGIINGWLTRNEARKLENLNPLDGLDEPLIPLNLGTQAERDALANDVSKAMKSMMIGHNGGPDMSKDPDFVLAMEAKVASVLEDFMRRRRDSGTVIQ